MSDIRECAHCGTEFTPRREHARFCSAACRMAWNRERGGSPAAPVVAIDWSAAAMAETVERFGRAGDWEESRVAAAVSETVWWITLVDATLVRYHPADYETMMSRLGPGPRRTTERTLEGLRYVRNQIGWEADPAAMISRDAAGSPEAAWIWSHLPPPELADAEDRTRDWELRRYRAYQLCIAGRPVAAVFGCCASFLERAASVAVAREAASAGAGHAR